MTYEGMGTVWRANDQANLAQLKRQPRVDTQTLHASSIAERRRSARFGSDRWAVRTGAEAGGRLRHRQRFTTRS